MSEMTLEQALMNIERTMPSIAFSDSWKIIKANLTRAPVQVTDAEFECIKRVLRDYRLTYTQDDDGDGYPLIDALSVGHDSVKEGIEEIELIADVIAGELESLSARLAQPVAAKVPDEMVFFTNGGVTNVNDYIRGDRVLTCHKEFAWGWNACREAMLSQPHPQAAQGGDVNGEPVAWMWNQGGEMFSVTAPNDFNAWKWTPLYTHPAERVAVPEGWLFYFADDDGRPHAHYGQTRDEVYALVAEWMTGDLDGEAMGDAGNDMIAGVTDTLIETGAFYPEGDPPCFLRKLSAAPALAGKEKG